MKQKLNIFERRRQNEKRKERIDKKGKPDSHDKIYK